MAYGINGEVLIGKLVLGENLMFANDAGTLRFNESGFIVENETNSVTISPGDDSIFNIKKGNTNLFYIDKETGDIYITGNIIAASLTAQNSEKISGFADIAITGKASDLINEDGYLKTVATTGSYKDLLDKPNLSNVATSGNYNDLLNTPTLATVATSGKYEDLTDAPELSEIATMKIEESHYEKLLYIDDEGKPIALSIEELKTMLGI